MSTLTLATQLPAVAAGTRPCDGFAFGNGYPWQAPFMMKDRGATDVATHVENATTSIKRPPQRLETQPT